jgi:hypothetical protein
MSDPDDLIKAYSFYQQKCVQHLHRARLSLRLAVDHIRSASTNLEDYRDEAEQCGLSPTNVFVTDMASIAIKTHFLLLKVNFEYYLNRIILCACDRHFGRLVHNAGFIGLVKEVRKDLDIGDLISAIAREEVKDYVLTKVVPPQGLDRFEAILNNGMNISLPDVIGKHYWGQIFCAFELRHLIEHRNGKVDPRFLKRVAGHWRTSSWADTDLAEGKTVEIRQRDFDRTFDAMLISVNAIAAALDGFKPNR